jgi:hypothetical protein
MDRTVVDDSQAVRKSRQSAGSCDATARPSQYFGPLCARRFRGRHPRRCAASSTARRRPAGTIPLHPGRNASAPGHTNCSIRCSPMGRAPRPGLRR